MTKPLTNAERQARHRAKRLDLATEVERLGSIVAALEKRVAQLEAANLAEQKPPPGVVPTLLPPPPTEPTTTLASRPMLVKAAEQEAVKKAERAVWDAWHRQPKHLTINSPEAKAHDAALRAGKGYTAVQHPLRKALAQARAVAREDFRAQQAGQKKQDAGALPDLPPHITRLPPLVGDEARAAAREAYNHGSGSSRHGSEIIGGSGKIDQK